MESRICDLRGGVTLIVGDLGGDREAFTRYVARFRQLYSRGRADRLLLLGDLIGTRPGESVLRASDGNLLEAYRHLHAELGGDRILALLGDRELAALTRHDRSMAADLRELLEAMPLFMRSASGVVFTHAGVSRSGLRALDKLATGMPSAQIAPEIVQTACEQAESRALYARLVERFLVGLSALPGMVTPQRFIVSGHLPINGGYQVATPRHLRIASAACAYPREAGIYLLLDLAEPIHSLEGLAEHLGSVFTN